MRRFAWRRRRLLGAALLTALVTATDWPTELLEPFWGKHPIASAVGSGIVLLLFAAFVVEAVLEERELRNWEYVAELAYYSLGHLASEMLVGMDFLVTGLTEPNHTPPLGSEMQNELRSVLVRTRQGSAGSRRSALRHRVLALLADAFGRVSRSRSSPTSTPADKNTPVDKQLVPLVRDLQWLRLAREGLSALKFRHRENVARWIPAMAITEPRARLLNAVALLDDKRDVAEGCVIALIKRRDPEYPDAAPAASDEDAAIDTLIANWLGVYRDAIALQELLMQLGRGDDWRSVPGRARISKAEQSAVDRRLSDLQSTLT